MTVALIPAAGRGSRMFCLTDENPKVMLPLDNKPLIAHHLDKLIAEGIRDVIIVVGYRKEKVIDYVDRFYAKKFSHIAYVEQTELSGLATAVGAGIRAGFISMYGSHADMQLQSTNLLVVLGDTIVTEPYALNAYRGGGHIGWHEVDDYRRWCLLETETVQHHAWDAQVVVTRFADKPANDPGTRKAVIGVYSFTNIPDLLQAIDEVVAADERIRGEFQLSSAMERYIANHSLVAHEYKTWQDVGELETFNRAKKNAARHFNNIRITNDGTLVKSSKDGEKIRNEINWYLHLPNKLRVYLPQLIDYSSERDDAWYELEYVNFAPLHELFMYTMPEMTDWRKIIGATFEMLRKYRIHSSRAHFDVKRHVEEVLVTKTRARLAQLTDDPLHAVMSSSVEIEINGRKLKNLPVLRAGIEEYASRIIADAREHWQIVHGDLFFGNMLYDVNSATLKVIDPRGSFGQDGIYGDVRYDLAKLYHSIFGRYDFIVNGLCAIVKDFGDPSDPSIEYWVYDSEPKHKALEELFAAELTHRGYDVDDIRFITALLFLSMIPLHKDNEISQKIFYCKAIELFNEVL